jgi:AcrR family transcriptional regulator
MSRGLSAHAHSKVLESATELFADRGIDATSVDAIAAASGVSKATIYKHWADKDALCLEVMQFVHELDDGPPEVDSGDLRADLIAFLKYEPSRKKAAIIKKLTPHLIAYSARNEAFRPSVEDASYGPSTREPKNAAAARSESRRIPGRAGRRFRCGATARADAVPAHFRVECMPRLAGGRHGGFVLESARAANRE